jgi:dehydrogenase/reductase SDR family protein 1
MGDRLNGKVCIVTGASRGLGKGIALGLGEAGATVYVTGRSTRANPGSLPGTIGETADELTRLGGTGIASPVDHRDDAQVEALFARVLREQGRLDLLVNNAMASPEHAVLWSGKTFWEIPVSLWDDLIDVGLRSHFVASRFAAPIMIEHGDGVIVNVASHAAGSTSTTRSKVILPYSVGKAGLHRLTQRMAADLRDAGVAVIEVWPPFSLTEGVLENPGIWDVAAAKPTILTGRVVAALVAGGNLMVQSGESLVIEDLAHELGIEG